MPDTPSDKEKGLSLYKVPPQNVQAEEAILSAILIDNNILHEVVDIIGSQDFYRTVHQKIFSAITDLFRKNEPVDLVTLAQQLKHNGQLDDVGGATYLARIVDTVPMAVNARHYAKIVHDKACLRRLIEQCNTVVKHCFEDSEPVEDIINFAEKAVFDISENKIRPAFNHIGLIIEQSIDILEERQGSKSLVTGVPTGFHRLDALTSGLQKSDLIILAARPSMGKTALALNMARNAALEWNVPVAIFSLEMSKEQLCLRLLCSEARIDSSRVRSGFFSRDDWVKLTNAAGVLSEAPIFIDDSPDVTALSIRAKARRLKRDQNLGLVVIDYIQLMKSSASAERRDLEISEISRSLKALAKELDVPVLALSQLNRKLEERQDKRPQLSDLRESGALEQDADVVAFIYRDEVYNKEESNPNRGKAEILLSKQRNGPTGTAHLTFLSAYTRFENLAAEDSPAPRQ